MAEAEILSFPKEARAPIPDCAAECRGSDDV